MGWSAAIAIKNPRGCRGWFVREPNGSSEAEGQELAAAGGVTVDQGTQADLVGDAGAGEALHHDADHKSEHGGAAVEELNPLELLHVDQLFCAVLEPLVVGGGVGHGSGGRWIVEKASVGGATRQEQGTSETGTNEEKREVAGAHGDQPSPIWDRMLWPVSSSVARPITKPSMARRPFQVSAKATNPKRGEESVMNVSECCDHCNGM